MVMYKVREYIPTCRLLKELKQSLRVSLIPLLRIYSCSVFSGIYFASFYHFDIWFWNCSDIVVFLVVYLICTQPKNVWSSGNVGVKTRVWQMILKSVSWFFYVKQIWSTSTVILKYAVENTPSYCLIEVVSKVGLTV
jgi:hypothetical protein